MENRERKLLKRQWLVKGGLGTSLFGAGIACAIESGFLKHGDFANWKWIVAGTVSLVLLMVGLIYIIKAALIEQELKK